jgi:pimeloyl-ACP methyl ester carboxylesterase
LYSVSYQTPSTFISRDYLSQPVAADGMFGLSGVYLFSPNDTVVFPPSPSATVEVPIETFYANAHGYTAIQYTIEDLNNGVTTTEVIPIDPAVPFQAFSPSLTLGESSFRITASFIPPDGSGLPVSRSPQALSFTTYLGDRGGSSNLYFQNPRVYQDADGSFWFEVVWTKFAPPAPRLEQGTVHEFWVLLGADATQPGVYEERASAGYFQYNEWIQFNAGFLLARNHSYLSAVRNEARSPQMPMRIRERLTALFDPNGIPVSLEQIRNALTPEELRQFSVVYTIQHLHAPTDINRVDTIDTPADDGMFQTNAFAPATREPVIIIPGIMGSRLKQITPLFEREVWPNLETMASDVLFDSWFNVLSLPPNGIPDTESTTRIEPIDVIGKISVVTPNTFSFDYSLSLFTYLENLGYQPGVSLFTFPYDWRLDIQSTSEKLKDIISLATSTSDSSKVNIIAHSMGGLVAKEYIQQFGGASINRLILVGTPNLGAPKAFKILTFGDNLGFQVQLPNSSIINLLHPPTVRDVAQNLPAVYQLLPSQNYFVVDPVNPDFFFYNYYVNDATDVDRNGVRGELDFTQTQELMINQGRNAQLFPFADSLHSSTDNWQGSDFGVQTFNIVGCESATLGQFILQNPLFGFIGKKFRPIYIDGDATVPLRSAESVGSDQTIYYRTQSTPERTEHAWLLTATGMPELIGEILSTGSTALPSYMTTERSGCSLSGFKIEDDSPVELHIYDSQGRHIGPLPNGDIEIGIPGAQYDRFEDEKYAFLPPGDTYQVIFQAVATGSANISIQEVENNVINQTISYFDVPISSPSTTAEFTLTPVLDNLALQLDQNGDGIFETSTSPTSILNAEESLDFTPPQTNATTSGVLGLNNWFTSDVQVTLTAEDLDSSGIFKTEYSLDGGTTWFDYQTPINITQEGTTTILYHSIDRAGNSENINIFDLKIDKTSPEAEIFFDTVLRTLKIMGVDNLSDTQVSQSGKVLTVSDEAGHTLKLTFEKFKQHRKELKADLETLQYDDNPPIKLPETELRYKWSLNKDQTIKELEQNITVAGEFKISAKYSGQKDVTKLMIKKSGDKKPTVQTASGLVIVKLTTELGELDFEF